MSDIRQIGRDDYRVVLKKWCSRTDLPKNQQYVHTPYDLCGEMIGALLDAMLSEPTLVTPPTEQTFLTINLEFVEVLCYDVGVKKANVWFVTDCKEKAKILAHPRYRGVNVVVADYLSWENNAMKFDVIAGNPPYNKPTKELKKGQIGNSIWPDFVKKSFELLKPNGFLCLVHPPLWRKPEYELWKAMTANRQMCYLSMMGEEEGRKTFGVSTKADWYVLKNAPSKNLTVVRDETGKEQKFDLTKMDFLPSYMIGEIDGLLARAGEEKCEVIYSRGNYGSDKEWMSNKKEGKFKYPCVHSLNSEEHGGMICWYSTVNDKGHFGVPKVILTWGRHQRPYNDYKGEYGTTQIAFGIVVASQKEGDLIVAAINTAKFQEILKATKWLAFQTEWRFFKYLKKYFYKQFVDANGNEIV